MTLSIEETVDLTKPRLEAAIKFKDALKDFRGHDRDDNIEYYESVIHHIRDLEAKLKVAEQLLQDKTEEVEK